MPTMHPIADAVLIAVAPRDRPNELHVLEGMDAEDVLLLDGAPHDHAGEWFVTPLALAPGAGPVQWQGRRYMQLSGAAAAAWFAKERAAALSRATPGRMATARGRRAALHEHWAGTARALAVPEQAPPKAKSAPSAPKAKAPTAQPAPADAQAAAATAFVQAFGGSVADAIAFLQRNATQIDVDLNPTDRGGDRPAELSARKGR